MNKRNKTPRDVRITVAWIGVLGLVLAALIGGVFAGINKPDDASAGGNGQGINEPVDPDPSVNRDPSVDLDPSTETSTVPPMEPTAEAAGILLNLDDAKQEQKCKRENFGGYGWVEISPVVAGEEYRAGFSCVFGSSHRITGFLEFPVSSEKSTFTAVAGIEENAANVNFEARFSVIDALTGKVLQHGVATPTVPVEFTVPVSEVSRIRLFVESVGTTESLNDYEGVVAWADPTLQ